jgi:hypothetical protein
VEDIFFKALYIFLKPGILLSALSHRSTSFLPKILVTSAPVIKIIKITRIIPEPGIDVSRFSRDSGRSLFGTILLTTSKKNLITRTLRASGIQKRSPDIK